jgi:hypothetical protein
MKIKFNDYEFDDFIVKDGVFCGIPAKLIIPNHIGTKFTQKNKIFRSSIWSLDSFGYLELLSASYKKFVNFGENTEHFPVPTTLKNTTAVGKIDGSTVIIDYINNQISMRTRGVFTIEGMENKSDFDYCLSKYPKIVEWIKNNPKYSLIAEITTPNLKIVIDYGDEPDFWLTGAINKEDYSLMKQHDLDTLAKELGMIRPETYSFNNIDDMIKLVKDWENKEGIVLYSNEGQVLHKIKGVWYLHLHYIKSNFKSIDKIIDLWFDQYEPTYQEFEQFITNQFDYELWLQIKDNVVSICDSSNELKKSLVDVKKFVDETIKMLPTRKDQALKIISNYSNDNRASIAFKLLDNKELNKDDRKKLLCKILKKD